MSAYKPKNTSEEHWAEECRRLEREVADLRAELKEQKQIIARAKDARPIKRSPFLRVLKLVQGACMDLKRVAGGWLLELGNQARLFKKLSQVWDLFTTDDWVLSEIFNPPPPQKRDRVLVPKPILPVRYPVIAPAQKVVASSSVDLSIEEKIKLIESYAIALPPSMAQNLKDFSLEQVTKALGYYKATIAKGKEIKSATGWLLKCLSEQWYKNFVPEAPAYSSKIITASDVPHVEAAPFPSNFWEMAAAASGANVSDRIQERLDKLVPY